MKKALIATNKKQPTDIVKGAYNLSLTKEALGRLKEIAEYRDYVDEQSKIAEKITVEDDASNDSASELCVNLTKARKGLEGLQKYYTAPLEKNKKLIIGTIKAIGAFALGQEGRLRREMGDYFAEKENARLQAEAEQQAEEEAAQQRATRLGRSAPKLIPKSAPEKIDRKVSSEHGNSNIKLVWAFELNDIEKVPKQYLTVSLNRQAVAAAISAGTREIEGLKISQIPQVAVR